MNLTIQNNPYISFKSRNQDIKSAQNIMHKIKSEYDATSPYKIYLLSEKHNRSMSRQNLSNRKLYAFRQLQEYHLNDHLKYTKILLDVFKQARAANCKEYSELAFIIAKLNNFNNCNCVNFARLNPDGTFSGIEHTVLLINQNVPKTKTRMHKYYAEDITVSSAFKPSRKSIVIDPLFGIVDYWDNAVINYENIYPQVSAKNLYVGARDLILSDPKDFNKIKQAYPELLLNQKTTFKKQNFLKRIINFIFH